MLKNVGILYLRVFYTLLVMSFQTGTIHPYLEIELVPRNWPAKTMGMNSEIENRH